MVARQIGSSKSGAATGAGRLPEAPEGGVQAALCGKHRQGRWFESTIRSSVRAVFRAPGFSTGIPRQSLQATPSVRVILYNPSPAWGVFHGFVDTVPKPRDALELPLQHRGSCSRSSTRAGASVSGRLRRCSRRMAAREARSTGYAAFVLAAGWTGRAVARRRAACSQRCDIAGRCLMIVGAGEIA